MRLPRAAAPGSFGDGGEGGLDLANDAEAPAGGETRPELVPRFDQQGFGEGEVAARRAWVEAKTGARLEHLAASSVPTAELRGNVENPVGMAQVPVGIVGPLAVRGEHARGTFYAPFATTEGTLIRSYERGAVLLSRAGGVEARVLLDENRVSPVFVFDGVAGAAAFARSLDALFPRLRELAESTTRHGRLLRVEAWPLGREVVVDFCFSTGDAHGMNMIVKAADHACRWLVAEGKAERYLVFSGAESEKRASGRLFRGGKGKKVTAGARLPARLVRAYLHTTPRALVDLWQRTVLGNLQAASFGYNGHFANGLAGLFIACGQDVANLANAAVGVTVFDELEGGDLYASVTLPSLTVATVGGGTALGTAAECLRMIDCAGAGKAPKLAEIAASLALAGELSMAGAIASGEFVEAHETYGRNRPEGSPAAGEGAP